MDSKRVEELAPLPEPGFSCGDCSYGETAFTEDQMHAHYLKGRADAAREAAQYLIDYSQETYSVVLCEAREYSSAILAHFGIDPKEKV